MVEFLVENYPEIEFTDIICRTFPEVIGETLVNFFTEVKSQGKHEEDDLFLVSRISNLRIADSGTCALNPIALRKAKII